MKTVLRAFEVTKQVYCSHGYLVMSYANLVRKTRVYPQNLMRYFYSEK